MKRALCLLPFAAALVLAACTDNAPVPQSEATQSSTVQSITPKLTMLHRGERPPVNINADFCFTVYGSCGFQFCDGDWNDTQSQSEVCCYNGSCVTEGYWTCGGPCMPESSSCSCSTF